MENIRWYSAEKGFGLVETMITILISAILLIGTLMLMMNAQRSGVTQNMFAQVQENGRISLEWIAHDIRMAGNRGLTYTLAPLLKTTVGGLQPSVSGNCFTASSQALDWATALLITNTGERTPAIIGENNLTTSGPAVFSGCISATDVQPGSDIISMHYLEAFPIEGVNLQKEQLYVSSGLGGAVVFKCPADASGASCESLLTDKREDPSGSAYFRLVSRAYYVRNWSATSGDGIPTLVRVELQYDGSTVSQALMEGVRTLQVRFGVDNNDDGFLDQYKTAAQMPALSSSVGLSTDWSKIKAVKLDLLVQSIDADPRRGDGDSSYSVAGETVSLPEKYLAEVFTTTVTTRNARTQGGT